MEEYSQTDVPEYDFLNLKLLEPYGELLYLKTEVEINPFKIDVHFNKLINANFESMKTILTVLKENISIKLFFPANHLYLFK